MPSSLSFRSVEALLHWCDHFFRIAVANANRRGMTVVYDPYQDRARFGEHATSRKAVRAQPSCRCRRRAGDTNSISRRACSMTYHQKMSFKHGRGGFHWTTTLPTSHHHQASFFFQQPNHQSRPSTGPTSQEAHPTNQKYSATSVIYRR